MNPLLLSPAARHNALARSLYRRLLRQCQLIPPNASLVHLDQFINDTKVKDRDTLRLCLKSSFRSRSNGDHAALSNNNKMPINIQKMNGKEGMQRAMEGLKFLSALDFSQLSEPEIKANVVPQGDGTGIKSSDEGQQHPYSLKSPISSDDLLRSVEWLPHISETNDVETGSSQFPVFPLSGPLFPDDHGKRLPLLSQFSELPVVGMEIPLQVFEPRYRDMYHDLLSSTNKSRQFIVPFPHPYRPGQFASFGWIYEIVRVQDVADETNGKFQLVCDHVVTKAVKIRGIENPQDYDTQSTYLRARADIIQYSEDGEEDNNQGEDIGPVVQKKSNSTDLQPLESLLQQLQNQPLSLSSDNKNRQIDKSLIDRLLIASGEGSIWPVVQVWISNLQKEILRLQMKIMTRIQLQAKSAQQNNLPSDSGAEWQVFVTEEMISLAQEPYESHLRCMLIEVSTLIPWLLQEESHEAQCHLMCGRIRDRLMNKKEHY